MLVRASATSTQTPLIDGLLGRCTNVQCNFVDPTPQLARAMHEVTRMHQAARHDRRAFALTSPPGAPGACPNCGAVGRVAPDADGAGFTCECGACLGKTMREAGYEARKRGDFVLGVESHDTTVEELASSAARQRKRVNAVAGCNVPNSFRGVGEKILKQASRDDIGATTGMDDAQRVRMESAQKSVCKIYEESGIDPDSNRVCQHTYNEVRNLFVRGSRHLMHCHNECLGRDCIGWIVRPCTKPQAVALACVHSSLMKANECAVSGAVFEGLDADAVGRMGEMLSDRLNGYKSTTAAEDADLCIQRLMQATPETLFKECVPIDSEMLMISDEAGVDASVEGDDGWLKSVSKAIYALAELVQMRERPRDALVARVSGPACHLWLSDVHTQGFHADLAAAMLVCHFSENSKSNAARKCMLSIARRFDVTKAKLDTQMRLLPTSA